MLGAGQYSLGFLGLALALGAAGLAAVRLRARLLEGWEGAPARLAELVLAIALLTWPAQLLGTIGLFAPLPYLALLLTAAIAAKLWVEPHPPPHTPPVGRKTLNDVAVFGPRSGIVVVAALFAAVVVAHWSLGTRAGLSVGMTGFDSTWYHGPFAAGFVAGGNTFDLQLIAPQYLAWFYPQNSELLHSVGIAFFDRDFLSPMLSLGWLAGCLLAAWCIGRPFGAAPISMAGAALALDSGMLADQAGEARNDVVATFFLLAAVAILLNNPQRGRSRLAAGVVAISGLAAGLAAGTKVNFLAPAGAMLVAVAVLAWTGASPELRRRASLTATAIFGGGLLAGGGYWYLRNLAHAGNPLPWITEAGPIGLPGPDQELGGRESHGVLEYLFDGSVWGDWFAPGLHDGLGVLWPLVVVLALAGLVAALMRGAAPEVRLAAVVGLAALGAWLVAPASAEGPEGEPLGFFSGLRYLAPAIAIGLALLPALPVLRARRRRMLLLGVFVAALPFVDASGEAWASGYLAGAVVVGVVVAVAVVGAAEGWVRRLGLEARVVAIGIIVLLAGSAAGGYALQRDHLEKRYADPTFTNPGLDAAFAWARDLSDERIATNTTRQYPFWGTDLSNEVEFVGIEKPNGGYVRPETCAEWREAVNRLDPRYLVTSLDRLEAEGPAFPPEAGWTATDPAATVILRRAPAVVFELSGALDPAACPDRTP